MFACPWGLLGLQSRILRVMYSVLKFFSPCRGGWGLGDAISGDIMVAPEIFVFWTIWRCNVSLRDDRMGPDC